MARDLRVKRPLNQRKSIDSIQKPQTRDLGDWFEPPAGTLPTPGSWGGAGMQQNPGTVGIMDQFLGYFQATNPEYFDGSSGSMWQGPITGMNDLYYNYWLQHMSNQGFNFDQFSGGMHDEIDWDMAGNIYDWWTTFAPEGNYSPFTSGETFEYWEGGSVYDSDNFPWTQWTPSGPGWSASNMPDWGDTQTGFTPSEELLASGVGGGNIGGSGDLGTGAWAAGGTAWNTLQGTGGLWEYDCDSLGPSYNSAGECIACCE